MTKLLSNIRGVRELEDIIDNLGINLPEKTTETTLRTAIANYYGEYQNNIDIDISTGLLIVRNHKTKSILFESPSKKKKNQ